MEKAIIIRVSPITLIIALAVLVVAGIGIHAIVHKPPAAPKPTEPVPHVVIGIVTGIEPFHVYLDGIGAFKGEKFDILTHKDTSFSQLAPWEPGEREAALKSYNDMLAHLVHNKDSPTPIPTPPQDMKLVPWTLDASAIGREVGVEIDAGLEPGDALSARGIRPLVEREIAAQAPDHTFPW